MKKIGILGGTFDPIHYGHLRIAQISLEEYDLDSIIFIPSGNPPHKLDKQITEGRHRLNMVKSALEDNPRFQVSDYEIDQQEVTYTINTIEEIKKEYDDNTEFYFIIGADAFLEMDSWKNISKFLDMVELIVLSRSYYKTSKVERKIEEYKERYSCKIKTVYAKTLNISATSIRKLVQWKMSIKYLLPAKVEEYILENGLYLKEKK